ncbi:MAG: YbhB/YbcL family Raf kinase inhibitor-like protein [Halobacteriaceae archaeon]
MGPVTQGGTLSLSSPAFDDGESIPRQYGKNAANVNPPLRIGGVPDAAASLALVVDDPDAVDPAGEVWTHWLVWNVDPGRGAIPEGWSPSTALQGTNDFGNVGYDGPAPPEETHTYRFKLFALDTTLGLERGAKTAALDDAMASHVSAATQLTGTYAPV